MRGELGFRRGVTKRRAYESEVFVLYKIFERYIKYNPDGRDQTEKKLNTYF